MSEADRQRWNTRYAEGAYVDREHPSAVLLEWSELLPANGRALDIACGAGRNAIYLAQTGFRVDALDISTVALDRGRKRAAAEDLAVHFLEQDFDDGNLTSALEPGYDLIIMVRFVDMPLVSTLPALLRPGGYLLVEEHLQWPDAHSLAGPSSDRFRVAPGALAEALPEDAIVVRESEGLVGEPDGSTAALARVLARAPVASE